MTDKLIWSSAISDDGLGHPQGRSDVMSEIDDLHRQRRDALARGAMKEVTEINAELQRLCCGRL